MKTACRGGQAVFRQSHTSPAGAMMPRCGALMLCSVCVALAIRPASGFAGAPLGGAPCLSRGKYGLLATGLRVRRLAGLPGAAPGRREKMATRTSTHGGSALAFDRAGVSTSASAASDADTLDQEVWKIQTDRPTDRPILHICMYAYMQTCTHAYTCAYQ